MLDKLAFTEGSKMVEHVVRFLVFRDEAHVRQVLVRRDEARVALVRGYRAQKLPTPAATTMTPMRFRQVDGEAPSEFPVVVLFTTHSQAERLLEMEIEEVDGLIDYVLQKSSGSIVLQ